MLRTHGEIYEKKLVVDNGRILYRKRMRFCARCGEIDLFLFPNFDADHAGHATPRTNIKIEFIEDLPDIIEIDNPVLISTEYGAAQVEKVDEQFFTAIIGKEMRWGKTAAEAFRWAKEVQKTIRDFAFQP